MGADQAFPLCMAIHIPTSGFPSAVPPNQAAINPPRVSAIAEAWHWANGAFSKMNSDFSTAYCGENEASINNAIAPIGNTVIEIVGRPEREVKKGTSWSGIRSPGLPSAKHKAEEILSRRCYNSAGAGNRGELKRSCG